MTIWKLATAALCLATAAGCLDLPVDEWDGTARRRRQAPAPVAVAVPSGETNIYVREPVYYAGPIYTESTYVRRRYPANFNVYGTGTYKGVNYGVGYGGGPYYGYGGYGWANGTKGKTQWNASWGYPAYSGGYGGTNGYGIYGNGNGPQGSNVEPSRFSVYR